MLLSHCAAELGTQPAHRTDSRSKAASSWGRSARRASTYSKMRDPRYCPLVKPVNPQGKAAHPAVSSMPPGWPEDPRLVLDVARLRQTISIQDDVGAESHAAVLFERARLSSSTSLRFLSDKLVVTANFDRQDLRLYKLQWAQGRAHLLAKLGSSFGGEPQSTDLLDFDGHSRLLGSNLFVGTQTLYEVNVTRGTLAHAQDIDSFSTRGRRGGQRCHSTRFVPHPNRHIVASSGVAPLDRRGSGYRIVFYDAARRLPLLTMNATGRTKDPFQWDGPWHAQDLQFFTPRKTQHPGQAGEPSVRMHMLVLYTTSRVQSAKAVAVNVSHQCAATWVRYATRVAHYVIRQEGALWDYEEISTFDIPGKSHPDSIAIHDELVFVSDQMNDCIHVLRLVLQPPKVARDSSHDAIGMTQSSFRLVGRLTGFFMPHGLHIRESMDAPGSLLLGCSNYGDSSYALMVLPSSFLEACRRAW